LSADFDVGRRAHAKVLKAALAPVALLELLPFHPRPGRHIDYTRYPNSGDWNLPRMIADVGNTTWRVYLYCSKASYAVHADTVLAEIRVPVVLMHGRKDTIFSVQNSIYMATRIPTVDLVVLDDADHILVLNRPREVGDAIENFLHRPERARSGFSLLDDREYLSGAQTATHIGDCNQRRAGEAVPDDPDGL
jgi:pimeloyl-ACP methyl ester carboxylesterase